MSQRGAGPHHEEGVANPEAAPAHGALGDGDVLAVDGDGHRGRLAHGAAADVRPDVALLHGHHGKGRGRRQPIGLVVPAGVVAHVPGVAVQEGHGAESGQTGTGQT